MSVVVIQETSEFPSHIEAPGTYPITIDEEALVWYDMDQSRAPRSSVVRFKGII